MDHLLRTVFIFVGVELVVLVVAVLTVGTKLGLFWSSKFTNCELRLALCMEGVSPYVEIDSWENRD